MPLELADDRDGGVRGELDVPLHVEAVDRVQESDARDLHEVLQRLAPPVEPTREVLREWEEHPDKSITGLGVIAQALEQLGFHLTIGGADRTFERAHVVRDGSRVRLVSRIDGLPASVFRNRVSTSADRILHGRLCSRSAGGHGPSAASIETSASRRSSRGRSRRVISVADRPRASNHAQASSTARRRSSIPSNGIGSRAATDVVTARRTWTLPALAGTDTMMTSFAGLANTLPILGKLGHGLG